MTPEDAARQTTAHTEPDDRDFDTVPALRFAILWALVMGFGVVLLILLRNANGW
jgi:hypothetical protein